MSLLFTTDDLGVLYNLLNFFFDVEKNFEYGIFREKEREKLSCALKLSVCSDSLFIQFSTFFEFFC